MRFLVTILRRLRLLSLLPLLALPGGARAALPEVSLAVEMRWVDSTLPGAAAAGVRDGAVVVGTAGTVSPRGPGTVTSTAAAEPPPVQRLLVLNGRQARLQLTTREPLQWVDTVVDLAPNGSVRGMYAQPQTRERRSSRSLAVTPAWPGGRAPVRVTFDVEDDTGAHHATLDLPLARWHTVARSGAATPPAPRGTTSSRDASGQPERELQLRVSVQP